MCLPVTARQLAIRRAGARKLRLLEPPQPPERAPPATGAPLGPTLATPPLLEHPVRGGSQRTGTERQMSLSAGFANARSHACTQTKDKLIQIFLWIHLFFFPCIYFWMHISYWRKYVAVNRSDIISRKASILVLYYILLCNIIISLQYFVNVMQKFIKFCLRLYKVS